MFSEFEPPVTLEYASLELFGEMEKLRQCGVPEKRIVSFRFDSMGYEDMTAKQKEKADNTVVFHVSTFIL